MATSRDPIALAHAAASAIERLCATLDDCAREVEARGGQRVARAQLAADKVSARAALRALAESLPPTTLAERAADEIGEMAEGAACGFARPSWALRVVRLAQEVSHG